MSFKPARRPHFFYTTAPLPCPYLPGRMERKVVTELAGVAAESLHDRLSRGGFRRSHNIAYAPVCPSCNACVPIRIRARDFSPTRTQKRIARRNADLIVQEMPARATAEQFQLFQRYQQMRHGDGDMATMSFYDYRAMVEDTPIETGIVEFRHQSGALLGACLTDRLGDGLSAVYSFFETGGEERSLGTFAILWLVEYAVSLGLPHVYLGYWVEESRKMAYKAKFRPSEVLRAGQWLPLAERHAAGAGVRLTDVPTLARANEIDRAFLKKLWTMSLWTMIRGRDVLFALPFRGFRLFRRENIHHGSVPCFDLGRPRRKCHDRKNG